MRADARLSSRRTPGRAGSSPYPAFRLDDESVYAPLEGGLDPLTKWDKKVWFVVEGLTKSFQARFGEEKRLPRIVGEVTRGVLRDGDGDQLVTNPLTGVDDMPVDELVDLIRDNPKLMERLSERINERMTTSIGKRRRTGSSPRRITPGEEMVDFIAKQFDMVFDKEGDGRGSVLDTLAERDMGFTISSTTGQDFTHGYAVARPGRGLRVPASSFYDQDGRPTDVGIDALMLVIMSNIEELSKPQDGASRVAIGGWHSPKRHDADGRLLDDAGLPVSDPRDAADCPQNDPGCITFVYLDITDVFDEADFTDEQIYQIGNRRNQQSVARLSAIASGNYTSANRADMADAEGKWAFLDTGGTGMDVLDERTTQAVAETIVGQDRGES